jgi:hypothetical protein
MKKLIIISFFLVLIPIYSYSQTINYVILAENIIYDNEYYQVVENDIKELNINGNYIEKIYDRNNRQQRDELLFFEDLFLENIHNIKTQGVYRLIYELDNTLYIVYSFNNPPYSLFRYLRIYISGNNM